MEKPEFDGIILPNTYDFGFLGSIIGITLAELKFGPEDIKLNIAYPKSTELNKAVLFWLENLPETGPYSKSASYYWIMPEFSELSAASKMAVRIKPTSISKEDKTFHKYDYIFWERGKPVTLGHQYSTGNEMNRNLFYNNRHLNLDDVIKAWQNEEYDMKFSKTLGEMDSIFDKLFADNPRVQINKIKRSLEIQTRNAGWETQRYLVSEFV